MKRILIPVDFSPSSKDGFVYAQKLSLELGARLIALFVPQPPQTGEMVDPKLIRKLEERTMEHWEEKIRRFTSSYPNSAAPEKVKLERVQCIVKEGKIVETILKVVQEQQIDAIIMGTRSKHNWWNHLTGSVASRLCARATVPVFIIPEGYAFQEISEVAYATDLKLSDDSEFAKLTELSQQLGARINRIHIAQIPSDFSTATEEVIDTVMAGPPDPEGTTEVSVIRNFSVAKGLQHFIDHHQIDLLSMTGTHKGLFERLVRGSSMQKMVLQSPIPLLVLPVHPQKPA
jgi:nucleotide-binding universal stress UspA family protein